MRLDHTHRLYVNIQSKSEHVLLLVLGQHMCVLGQRTCVRVYL